MANQYNVTDADHIFLLKYIRGYIKVYGWPPTIREMTEILGLASTSPTRGRIAYLEGQGWITRAQGVARGVRITKKGHAILREHDRRIANNIMMSNLGKSVVSEQ